MEAMKTVFVNAINGGNFVLSEMETKIDTMWIKGSLDESERNELLELAATKANDINQIDVVARIADLERRVNALENPVEEAEGEPEVVYPVYEPGYITSKNEIVLYDYDEDGTLDLMRYAGGRATTSLSPGKVSGWEVLNDNLEVIGTFYKGVFTPVETEPEVIEPENAEPSEGTSEPEQPSEETPVEGE